MDSAIIVLLITTSSQLIFGIAKMIMKSKCKTCKCFGCEIIRDVELEEKEAEFNITHNVKE
jgi:hypothetical protein